EQTYDVTRALAKLTEINPHADAKQWLTTYLTFPGHPSASIHEDGNYAKLQLSATRLQHATLAGMLSAIERSGPWQVAVETRVFRNSGLDAIGDIDWQEAVKFPLPPARKVAAWPSRTDASAANNGLSLSVESVSYEFAPYLALVIDAKKM